MKDLYDHIEYIICAGEGVNIEDLYTGTRKGEIMFAKQLIMYFAVEFKLGGYTFIADRYKQDHSTVNNSLKTINNYIATDKEKRGKINYYRGALKAAERVSARIEGLLGMFAELDSKLAELEQRYINLQLLVKNLKTELVNLK